MIYLDNAATSGKKPSGVIKTVENALLRYNANPGRSGHKLSLDTAEKVYETRKAVAEFFSASGPENVVFTLNCTAALNYVIKGVLAMGDHVIISDIEHNAVFRPVYKLAQSGVITYDVAQVDFRNPNITVDNFEKLIKPNTKMIICSAASNVCGIFTPIAQLGMLCKNHGLLFTVDAAQSAGVSEINMKKMNIDFLAVAAHKGLYAPMGTGILIAEKDIKDTIIEGGTGSASLIPEQPQDMPERLESGTLNVAGIMGIKAGISYVNSIGIDRIYRHEISLIESLYEELSAMKNIKLYTPYPQIYGYAPVLSFNIEEKDSTEVSEYLNKKGIAVRAGYHCAALAHKKLGTQSSGTVRVSTGSFNTKNEIKYLVNMLKFI